MQIKNMLRGALLLLFSFLLMACSKVFPPSPYDCENLPQTYKDVFIMWRASDVTAQQFEQSLFADVTPQLKNYNSPNLRYWLADETIESMTLREHPREDGARVAAVISIELEDNNVAELIAQQLRPFAGFVAGYKVNHSLPLNYTKTWADGEVSPGVVSMSFFQRKPGQSQKDFKDYWFCSHTPFALDIHPLWRYERNPVIEAVTKNAPAYNGIVPLHMQSEAGLEAFSQFFAADGNNAIYNALRIQNDVSNFIDLDKIEATAMREYVMTSPLSKESTEAENE